MDIPPPPTACWTTFLSYHHLAIHTSVVGIGSWEGGEWDHFSRHHSFTLKAVVYKEVYGHNDSLKPCSLKSSVPMRYVSVASPTLSLLWRSVEVSVDLICQCKCRVLWLHTWPLGATYKVGASKPEANVSFVLHFMPPLHLILPLFSQ